MTDTERAADVLSRLYDLTPEELTAEFAAARLDERNAISAYLLGVAKREATGSERDKRRMLPWVMLEIEALLIGRGEHAAGGSS